MPHKICRSSRNTRRIHVKDKSAYILWAVWRRLCHDNCIVSDIAIGRIPLFSVKNIIFPGLAKLNLSLHTRGVGTGILLGERECGNLIFRNKGKIFTPLLFGSEMLQRMGKAHRLDRHREAHYITPTCYHHQCTVIVGLCHPKPTVFFRHIHAKTSKFRQALPNFLGYMGISVNLIWIHIFAQKRLKFFKECATDGLVFCGLRRKWMYKTKVRASLYYSCHETRLCASHPSRLNRLYSA